MEAIIYVFACLNTAILGYRIYLRIKQSYIFNATVSNISLGLDLTLFHIDFFLSVAYFLKDDHYYSLVLCTLPFSLSAAYYLTWKYKVRWVMKTFENEPTDKDKL